MTVRCAVCDGPYEQVADDPSRAHPSCTPTDPIRFRGVWSLLRWGSTPAQVPEPDPDPLLLKPGVMRALWGSTCHGCGWSILPGEVQSLVTVDARWHWVCRACATGVPRDGPGPAGGELDLPAPRDPEPDHAPEARSST